MKKEKMNNKNITVYLATKNDKHTRDLTRLIKGSHSGFLHVETVENAEDIFTTRHGLANIVRRFTHVGFVYVIRNEVTDIAIKMATDTKIPFAILSKNNTGWTATYVNRIVEANRLAPVAIKISIGATT